VTIFQHAPITWTGDTVANPACLNQEIKEKMDDIDNLIQAGDLKPTARDSAPAGWLLCDGAAISRTTYAALFTAIGTKYGVGDGSTTFNVPNLKGKVPIGLDSTDSDFDDRGKTGGEKISALSHWIGDITLGGGYNANFLSGSSLTHNNLQPYVVINWLIKY
jgi:microcystin-dependent protein